MDCLESELQAILVSKWQHMVPCSAEGLVVLLNLILDLLGLENANNNTTYFP
jgi:hypothetical protein